MNGITPMSRRFPFSSGEIESIMEDFYLLASKVHRGGHILIPERTYWHLPCGMESIEILCESIGLILEVPSINSGNAIMATIS